MEEPGNFSLSIDVYADLRVVFIFLVGIIQQKLCHRLVVVRKFIDITLDVEIGELMRICVRIELIAAQHGLLVQSASPICLFVRRNP